MNRLSRRRFMGVCGLGGLINLVGCTSDGHVGFLGYTTRPNYDPSIRTVYVPMFQSSLLDTSPYRGLERELTQAMVDAIEARGRFKVVSDPERADTELKGRIVGFNKILTNYNQFNQVRQALQLMSVDVVWIDNRNGRYITNPRRVGDFDGTKDQPAFDDSNVPLPAAPEKPVAIRVTVSGRMIPEVGESNLSMAQMCNRKMADQVVSMMEENWTLPRTVPPVLP